MGEARKHHYISRCYLQGFTHNGAKKSQLFVVSLAENKVFQSNASNVAHVRDFNRLEGLPAGALDNALGQFEGMACSALRHIETSRAVPSDEQWNYVLNLAALFAVRHPAQRENTRRFIADVSERVFDLLMAKPERYYETIERARAAGYVSNGREISFEEMKDFHERKQYDISVSTDFHVRQEMKVLDVVLDTFSRRHWTLHVAGQNAGHFATSDRPLMLMNNDSTPPTFRRPIGHATRGTMVVFPISKSVLAVGSYDKPPAPVSLRAADREAVARFNGITARYAIREVYGSDARFPVKIGQRTSAGGDMLKNFRLVTAPSF
ncbi:DUF4238 domain-containing protein [Achromobacter sp. LC458]|uniref:DUF4238 domain-containing protein n=1 Tax=Achromobacter TaxID=222 RepID=UPI000629E82A|nr:MULTISPECIES: DUF4238 domain-containing protein [Achromobacter]KNY05630.1 hypothetical protein AKG08_24950 [Achromobacter piechaudii]TRM52873.1 DUF4238 domain-containing protein [Achromobacter sp. LC458]